MLAKTTIFQLLVAIFLAAGSLPAAPADTKNGFDLSDALIPADEIRRGGPLRDGIPSLDNPVFVPAGDANFVSAKDRVLGLHLNGRARAYPISILNYHEIVNDVIAGRSIVVTYCPLCGTGVAFDATPIGDTRLIFGVSGLLYNSDVLMFDRNTESLWSQLKNLAISGPLKGATLEPLPVSHTTWRDWIERYPDTDVLSMRTGHRRNYRADPYPGYGNSGKLFFPVSAEDKRYRRKEMVLGVEIRGRFKAYPFEELENSSARFADSFQGEEYEVVFDEQNETARLLREDGSEIPSILAFWFAWYAFHPETDVYTAQRNDY